MNHAPEGSSAEPLDFNPDFSEAWERIQARRRFMEQMLGITLKPEVLPFSNLQGYLTPYVLNPRLALRIVR